MTIAATSTEIAYLGAARHRDWHGILVFTSDGRFVAHHNHDQGRWLLSTAELTLLWDRWPAEMMLSSDGVHYHSPIMDCDLTRITPENRPRDFDTAASLIIPFRESTDDRRENLESVIRFYVNALPHLDVIVVEQDRRPHLRAADFPPAIRLLFILNGGPFNRSWGFNVGALTSDRSLYLFSDADVLISSESLRVASLAALHYDIVKPYSRFVGLSPDDTRAVGSGISPFEARFTGGHMMNMLCGGGVLMTSAAFDRLGGWPEEFEGWGGEDDAQEAKASHLATVAHLSDSAYHLHHDRTKDDSSSQSHYAQNVQHLSRLYSYLKEEMVAYVDRTRVGIGNPNKYVQPGSSEAAEPGPMTGSKA